MADEWTLDPPDQPTGWSLDPLPEERAGWTVDPLTPKQPSPLVGAIEGKSPADTAAEGEREASIRKVAQETPREEQGGGVGQYVGDLARSGVAGVVSVAGMGLRGLGREGERMRSVLGGIVGKDNVDAFAEHWLAPSSPLTNTPLGAAGALLLNPTLSGALTNTGQAIQSVADTVNAPEERQNQVGNIIANATGQVAGMVALTMVGGEAATNLSILGQSFDQIDQALKEKGVKDTSVAALTAQTVGAPVMSALERTGLDVILEGVPLKIKSRILRGLADVGITGGFEAMEEVTQQVVQNFAVKLGVDPSTPVRDWPKQLGEGIEANAIGGGGAGAIVRAILGRWGGHAPARHQNEQSYAPPGMREGGALAADITPEDEASPLPTDLIAQGKMTMGAAAGTTQANETLRGAGVPDVGTRVSVSHNGKTQQGAVADAWTVDVAGQTSVGVKIRLDDGTMIEEPVDTLRDMGVTITPHLPEGLPEGDLADPEVRRLAAQGMEAVEAAQSPAGEVALPDAEAPNRAEAASGEAPGAIPGLPVSGPITSPFGHRTSPKAGASTEHAGVDIGVPAGTEVKAPAAGIVLHTGSGGQRGNWVELDHGDGTITRYMHLSEIDVERGDRVHAGQAFAKSGATGNVTGPHLHYSVIQNGQAVDPMKARFGREAIASNEPAKAATTGTEAPSNDREAPSSVQPAEPAEQDHGAALAGEPIDEEYTAFAPETGTLGIPRAEMPQIKAEHRGAMVNFLNARGIEHEEVTLPANEVKPTQAEFSPAKVEKAKAFEGGDRAILIDQAGHVVDGHHQYVAAHDLGEDIRAIRLKAPVRKIIDELREMPSVETEGQPSGGQLAANSEPQNIPKNIPAPSKQDAMKAKMAAKRPLTRDELEAMRPAAGRDSPLWPLWLAGSSGVGMREVDRKPSSIWAARDKRTGEIVTWTTARRNPERDLYRKAAPEDVDVEKLTPEQVDAELRSRTRAGRERAASNVVHAEFGPRRGAGQSKQDALKERMKSKRAPTQHNQIATDEAPDINRPRVATPEEAGVTKPAPAESSTKKVKSAPAKPVSVIAFVRRIGGIKDNEGHNLSKGRGLRRHPGLINNKTGRSIDAIGEALWEAGYIGTPADRPTEAEVLELLDEADRRPVYTKHEQEPAGQQTREEQLTAQEADAEHDIRTVAGDAGIDLNGDEIASALHYYLTEGITAQEAIERTIYQSAALDLADIAAATRSEYDYADVADQIFVGNEAEARGGAEESGERPVDLTGAATESEAPAQESRTAPAAEARAPDEGRDSPGSGQLDAFGEQPGDQRRALEQQAEGRLRSDRIQKAPGSDGGLFDTRDATGDLLEPSPASNNEPSGPRSGQAEEENRGSSAESPPRPGLTALFDDEDTARQIGWLDPSTGTVEPMEPGTESAPGTDSSQVRAQDQASARRTVEIGPSDVDRIRARLLQRMDELGLKDRYSLEVANGLRLERDHTRGQIDLYRKIISIALDRSENPDHSLDHEAIHALGPSGLRLIAPAEWDVLVEAAWADDRLREWAQTAPAYQHLGLDDQKEEAAAEYVADAVDAMRGRAVEGVPLGRVQGTIYRAVHRIARFWNALRHAVSYLRTGEAADLRPIDVVLRIDRGEVGKRTPAPSTVRGRPVEVTFGRRVATLKASVNKMHAQGALSDEQRDAILSRLGEQEVLAQADRASEMRRHPLPPNERPLSAFEGNEAVNRDLKAHPDYTAAKAGDAAAALRLVRDLVPRSMLEQASERWRGAIFVPVTAEEATGHNQIPRMLAELLANAADGSVDTQIIQNNRAFHTGAAAMDRLVSRPLFEGPVESGHRYIVVDDVTVMGATLAELAHHLQEGGGDVLGTALLVNAARNPVLGPNKLRSKAVERRFGNVVRNDLGVEPAALTGPESEYLLNFRDADALRARIASARSQRSERLRARGLGEETGAEGLNGPSVRAQAATAQRLLTRSVPFKRWFGDSKVVDGQGHPLIVYHGTSRSQGDDAFTMFDTYASNYGLMGMGGYFTADPAIASQYTKKGRGDAPTIYPAYLSIQNPIDMDAKADPEQWAKQFDGAADFHEGGDTNESWYRAAEEALIAEELPMYEGAEAMQDGLRAMGYDGITHMGGGRVNHEGPRHRVFVAFDPEQIKSATGNNGAFDPTNPDIRAQAAPPPGGIPSPLGRSFDDEAAAPPRLWAPVRAILDAAGDGDTSERVGEAIDRFRAVVQDRMLPVLRTQARIERMLGRTLSDDENPYLGEELLSGRTGARLEALTENHVEPLFEEMRKAKISPEELETFLYARHAPERNARIAAINPEFGEGEGSGMSDAEAADIMAAVDDSGKRDALEQLAARVDAINAFSVQTRVEAGLLSQDEANIWRTTYQHYVPLRGRASDAETGNVDRVRRQTGISVKGKESRRAFGRKSRAADILPYTILQAEEAIARAEQNEVARQFLELARAAPDPDFWRVDKIRRVPVFNKGSGQVSYRAESRIAAEDAPYTVSVKVEGDEHRVTMNRENPSAVRVAEAMRNLNAQQFGVIVRTFGAINRFLSAINTSYSPEFVVTNALRDLQTATINLSAEKAKGMVRGVLKDYPAALKAATKGSFGKGGGAWGKWYQEFKLEGGRTYFNQGDDLAVLRGKVERAARLASTRFGAKHMLIAASHLIEGVNAGVENALRLATYKNAREAGLTAKQAASMAKNVTVNFNRKGSAGPVINALYLFFNASMQGNARILIAMKSRKVQAILFSAVLMGFWLQLLNSLWSDRDDDGEAFYDKIPEFEKARNLILMLPGEHGRYVKLPLPWGYNVFPNLGRMMARMYQGERGMTAIADWAKGLLDAFNPVGGSNSLLNLISPTITDPIVDLVRNRDFADKPIMPDEKQFGPEIPDSQRYWGSVPPYWKAVTDFLAHETGGDAVRPGAIDISPETLDYLQQTVLGAAGNLVRNGMSIASKLMSDDPTAVVTTAEIPFERKVVGDKPSWYDKAAFYARLAEVEQAVDYGKKYIKSGDDAGLDKLFADQGDVLELETAAKHARKEMRGIRKEQRTVDNALANGSIDDETARIATAMLDAKQQDAITAFNARYIATVKQPLRP